MEIKKEKYKYLKQWLVGYRGVVANILISSILVTFLGMNWPLIYRYIINKVFYDGSINELGFILLVYILLFLSEKFLQYIWKLSEAVMASEFLYKIRREIYRKYYSITFRAKEKYSAGELIDIINNDVQQIYTFLIDEGVFAITCFIRLLMAITYIFFIDHVAAFFILGLVIVNYILSNYLKKRFIKYYNQYKQNLEKFNVFLLDIMTGLGEIKILNAANFIKEKYTKQLAGICGLQQKQYIEDCNKEVSNEILNVLAEIVLYIVAAYSVANGRILLGDFVSLMIYYEWAKIFFGAFTQLFSGASRSAISIQRINQFMDTEEEDLIGEEAEAGDIEFRNVTFGYNKRTAILKNVNLKIKKGSTIAIAGPSGSGKSTLISLLLKFYPNENGDILLNQKSINQISCSSIRSKIGIVSQNARLFEGTIRYNLLIAKPDATEAELWQALKYANAYEFVEKLPNHLDSYINITDNLSTGQIQRIVLARVILKDPDIIILDEATSNIDIKTEKKFFADTRKIFKDKTLIIVAYRVDSLQNSDIIYFLKNGEIIARGNHNELSNNCKDYKELIYKKSISII